MRWKTRFLAIFLIASITATLYAFKRTILEGRLSLQRRSKAGRSSLSFFAEGIDRLSPFLEPFSASEGASESPATAGKPFRCSMETCFDLNRCRKNGFKVYVYPRAQGEKVSLLYSKILRSLRDSKYYTINANEACLFVTSLDTLDRDRLSPDYVHGLAAKIASLPHWNGGLNHLIFNFYSGTWPDYLDSVDFNVGKAVIAKASVSMETFREGFDVSIPLISKMHPQKGGRAGGLTENGKLFPIRKKYMLAFKGKRYLTGIGSETRNGLSLLHDGKEIILATTCRHGSNWESHKDDKCDSDQEIFEKFDYMDLLQHSTFCLAPRGRRLGSFRFLETMEANCIPVSLSNGYVLPFSEKIDWSQALLNIDERLLLQLPYIVRSISDSRIITMRQHLQFLWDTYFSSVDKIVATTLEMLFDRIYPSISRGPIMWNFPPGALVVDSNYSLYMSDFPFYTSLGQLRPSPLFTAVIAAYTSVTSRSAPLFNLIREIGKSQSLAKVLVLWMCDEMPPKETSWPSIAASTEVVVLVGKEKAISSRFNIATNIQTEAVLSLDEDTTIIQDEVEFALSVWLDFPDRIVGFPARSHLWDSEKSRWGYTSKWTNDYSMVLTGAAFIHRYYAHLYTHYLPESIKNLVDQTSNCDDIAMNFLVSHVTKKPPIKVTQRKKYYVTAAAGQGQEQSQRMSKWMNPAHFLERQTCINMFHTIFGYMPLVSSQLRLDPVLFKDPVAMLKKKYRKLETAIE